MPSVCVQRKDHSDVPGPGSASLMNQLMNSLTMPELSLLYVSIRRENVAPVVK